MEAETLGPWLGNLFYVLGGVYLIVRLINSMKRQPHVDVDFSAINTSLGGIDEKLIALNKRLDSKQDSTLCKQLHKNLTTDLDRVEKRHSDFEAKISRQVGGVHTRIDHQTEAIALNGGKLDTFMHEMTNWRNHHNA